MKIEELYAIFTKNPVICTDSRKIIQGSIFFSLKGENFNGNKYALQAIEYGCSYAIIDERKYKKNSQTILVNNVLNTLQELSNALAGDENFASTVTNNIANEKTHIHFYPFNYTLFKRK